MDMSLLYVPFKPVFFHVETFIGGAQLSLDIYVDLSSY